MCAQEKPVVPAIDTVVLQPTPFCNIACKYCYLPQRNDTSSMSLDTIRAVFQKVFASGWSQPWLTVIWHAGEPLVMPIAYYEAAFALIEELRPDGIEVRHAIQTNGMLINEAWCDFFRRWSVGLGVSIDGPQRIHDIHRVTRKGRGTFDKTVAGIRLLRREQVPFHVISVLSTQGMAVPEEMLDFYQQEGIEDVCFNVEESEGDHVSELFAGANLRSSFRDFLQTFWTRSRQTSQIRFLREIDGMLARIFRPEDAPLGNAQVQPLGMINVDCRGNVSSFSPELLGLKNTAYNDFLIGNIHSDTLEQMLHSEAMQAMSRDIAAGVAACQAECPYFSVCGGGSPINKLTENGSFASTRTVFCDLVHRVPTDLILNALDHLEDGLANAATSYDMLTPVLGRAATSNASHAVGDVDATTARSSR
jgi:uncharacterized protein